MRESVDPWVRDHVRMELAELRGMIASRTVSAVTLNHVRRGTGSPLLLVQFSARPWALAPQTVLPDLRGLADAAATGPAMDALTRGPKQAGAPAGTVPGRVTIGWGRRDRVTLPRQAHRALAAFPDATLHWFERCGHFPQWDAPEDAIRLILDGTDDRDPSPAEEPAPGPASG